MPIVLTGQRVSICSERARYHATRLGICVTRETPHHELYALVDVVVAVEKGQVRWPGDFVFSGHTLADQDWITDLTGADQTRWRSWLNESHVRYEIEGARRRLIYDQMPAAVVRQPYPDKLYSRLRCRIHAMPDTSMPARQWRQTLRNFQQTGICREELHWSGVLDWLATPGVDAPQNISRQQLLDNIDFFPIQLQMSNEQLQPQPDRQGHMWRTRYRYMSLFGGEDYREWLVTLPNYPHSYFGPHFTERNVLLHIRSKTHVDSLGRKLLLIEELQSDWHRQGGVPYAPYRKSWVGLGLKLMLLRAVAEGFDGLAWADGAIQSYRYGKHLPAVQRLYDETIQRTLLKLARPWGGVIDTGQIQSKVPWFRLEARKKKQVVSGRTCVMSRLRYAQKTTAILHSYIKSECLTLPVFIIPAGMVAEIRRNGLPLFGENLPLYI